jgi:hypothetical protein
MKPPPRKRRTREHIIADLSVNHVERHVLKCGFVVERSVHDYGIDLQVVTFSKTGEVQEGFILVQLKASDHLRIRPDQTTFAFRIERSDLVTWLKQPAPVILVVYDARKEVAYWLYIQSHYQKLPTFQLFAQGKKVTVRIPTKNVVNTAAVKKFARFRDRLLQQTEDLEHDDK